MVTGKDIASRTRMSPKTVQAHFSNIFSKTGAVNKVELVLMAVGLRPSPMGCDVSSILAEVTSGD
jgi:DNA-binding CsgD family transcriptional regulator